jgi:hypothetical protein
MRPSALLALLAVVALSPSARADEADHITEARALGTEGVLLAEAGKCPDAIDRLTRAEALHHAPTTLGRLGECQVAIGQVVKGIETLEHVVHEVLPAHAPPAFVTAQERAQGALEKARALVGNVHVHVSVPAPATPLVAVDGTALATPLLDVSTPVDPGSHTFRATAPGCEPQESTVVVRAGEKKDVALVLVPTSATTVPAASTQVNRTPAWIAFGAGAAGLAVGGIFGALSLAKQATLDAECTSFHCPAAQQSNISALTRDSWVTNVGFAVAIAGAGVGTGWLLTHTGSTTVTVTGGLGAASLQGRF